MNIPEELLYTKEHEWIRMDDGSATIGITDFAQSELGDVVFVELPQVGDTLKANDPFGSLESVKAVSEVYMPIDGEVTQINEVLLDTPEKINEAPYSDGWMIQIRPLDPDSLKELMNSTEYSNYVAEESKE
ncbi:MAG: glycine cleavage system protein GcvH [Acidobacteriota bacterium]